VVQFHAKAKDISLLQNSSKHPDYGIHPTYYSMDTGSSFTRSKVAGAKS
jgi:hypothetical protein